jgi:glycosyltransferase involved in cell wall biosynthesis
MTPIISIIVPVYNAGTHFTTLLDSILAQTFTQFELILVLDCPTDGSDKVAKAYAHQDARIVVIENERNLHIGFSRNKGLQIAKGNYIAFADHDDWVYPTWLEVLYNKAIESNADVVVSAIENRCGSKHDYYRFPKTTQPDELQKGMLEAMLCSRHSIPNTQSFSNANSIWNQLYKAQVIKDNDIQFPDNRKLSYEDALFNIEVFLCANKVVAVPETLYVHITHKNNTFDLYHYKSYNHLTAYLKQLEQLVFDGKIALPFLGESVLRKYFVCVFNEYKCKGAWATLRLLCKLRKHPFRVAVNAYKQTKPALTAAKKLFLLWIS